MSEQSAGDSDFWGEYRVTDAEIISEAADGFSLDINGTQVHFRQHEHVPLLLEIWVEDEEQALGSINVAKGTTVSLGGVGEGLTDEVEKQKERLERVVAELETLEYRLNPEGKLSPQTFLTRPDKPRFAVVCECGETWYPSKGADYDSRYSGTPWCPHCGTDWRDLDGAEDYVNENGNPWFQREGERNYRYQGPGNEQ